MIKVFKGGYEVAQEYYFNYESYSSDIYDSKTRIITGLLSLKNLTEFQQLAIVNNLEGSNLVIIEPAQSGYMVNLLNVREIEFTKNMSDTESIYRITGSKLIKPKKATNYKLTNLNNALYNDKTGSIYSCSVDSITQSGYIRMAQGTDIRYLHLSDTEVSSLPYEIGKCRIETGQDFYITQTGGSSHKMQMPSLSGEPFPNGLILFSGNTAKIKGAVLIVDYVRNNLEKNTDKLVDESNKILWGGKGGATAKMEYESVDIKSAPYLKHGVHITQTNAGQSGWRGPSGPAGGSYPVNSKYAYTWSSYIANNGDKELLISAQIGVSASEDQTSPRYINKTITIPPHTRYRRYSVILEVPAGYNFAWSYIYTRNSTPTPSDWSFAGLKVEQNGTAGYYGDEMTKWIK